MKGDGGNVEVVAINTSRVAVNVVGTEGTQQGQPHVEGVEICDGDWADMSAGVSGSVGASWDLQVLVRWVDRKGRDWIRVPHHMR